MRKQSWLLLFISAVFAALFLSGCDSVHIEKKGEQTVTKTDPKQKDEKESEFSGVDHPKSSLEDITEKATVTRVIDGDTVEIKTAKGKTETVRMLLVDTPESVHPDKPAQPYAEDASDYTKDWLDGMDILLERGKPDKDKYGRTLAHIWMQSGPNYVNFGKTLVSQGFARVAYAKPGDKYVAEFEEAQKKAKADKLNIWFEDGYVTDRGFDESAMFNRR